MGSWKIIEMRLPRILRTASRGAPMSSFPSSLTEPDGWLATG